MAKDFSEAEHKILTFFNEGVEFTFDNQRFHVILSGKPTCKKGEPKTDIYVLAKNNDNEKHYFKISFKKQNADFLENKMNASRAEQLLGRNWQNIIRNAVYKLKDEFLKRELIYKVKYSHTNPGSITLGWKFEILNKKSGYLSGDLNLTFDQVVDVYAGTHISSDKRHAYVDKCNMHESGIANFILFEDISNDLKCTQDVIDALIPIKNYVEQHPKVWFACKALNYRTFKDKYDGNRPLAVYIDWFVRQGKLAYNIDFNSPLTYGGDYAAGKLKNALDTLNVKNTDDLNQSNVEDLSIVHEND